MRSIFRMDEGGQVDPNQMANQIASMLQQGGDPMQIVMSLIQQQIQPEQIVQILLQAGLPQDQAMQAVQSVMQQVQSQQGAPQGQDPNAQPAGDPNMQQPQMDYGGEFTKHFKKDLNSLMPLPDSSSENYTDERFKVFSEAVKRNLAVSTLGGGYENSMVKAENGTDMGNPVSSPSATTMAGNLTQEQFNAFMDNYNKGKNQTPQDVYYRTTENQIPFYGYRDPRTMVPQGTPFGRLLSQYMNPTGPMNLVKTQFEGLPDDFDITGVLNGSNPNYSLDNVELFKKGLLGRKTGIRFNLNAAGQPVPAPASPANIPNSTDGIYETPVQPSNMPAENWNPPMAEMGVDLTYGAKSQFNPNDVADFSKNTADRIAMFARLVGGYNPERDDAFFSSANTNAGELADMSRGLYTQQGDFIPTDVGNQVLNPTNTYTFNNRFQMLEEGGPVGGPGDPPTLAEQQAEYDQAQQQLQGMNMKKVVIPRESQPDLYKPSVTGLKVLNVYKGSTDNSYFFEYEKPQAPAQTPPASTPAPTSTGMPAIPKDVQLWGNKTSVINLKKGDGTIQQVYIPYGSTYPKEGYSYDKFVEEMGPLQPFNMVPKGKTYDVKGTSFIYLDKPFPNEYGVTSPHYTEEYQNKLKALGLMAYGGDVDISDEEEQMLLAQGFKLTRH